LSNTLPQIVKNIRNFPKQDINWSTQKLISYSQMSMFNECPKKWSLQYVEGYKQFTSSIHTIFGSALHKAIQHYLSVFYEQSGAAADREDIIQIFKEALQNEYKEQYNKNNKQHFSNSTELSEFYEDGVNILEYFKKKRSSYFSKKGWVLVGCEVPLTLNPHYLLSNVIYQGYLDIVLYHEPTNEFLIIDFKTSTRGWYDNDKKDENKQFQLILYKHFFSHQFNVPIDKIKINFFILKRKLPEKSDFPTSRIQEFQPASGKIKTNKAVEVLNNFIETAFDENGYKKTEHKPVLNKNCKWCPFYKKSLCSATFDSE